MRSIHNKAGLSSCNILATIGSIDSNKKHDIQSYISTGATAILDGVDLKPAGANGEKPPQMVHDILAQAKQSILQDLQSELGYAEYNERMLIMLYSMSGLLAPAKERTTTEQVKVFKDIEARTFGSIIKVLSSQVQQVDANIHVDVATRKAGEMTSSNQNDLNKTIRMYRDWFANYNVSIRSGAKIYYEKIKANEVKDTIADPKCYGSR